VLFLWESMCSLAKRWVLLPKVTHRYQCCDVSGKSVYSSLYHTKLKGRIYKKTIRRMEGRIYISVVIGNACSDRRDMFSWLLFYRYILSTLYSSTGNTLRGAVTSQLVTNSHVIVTKIHCDRHFAIPDHRVFSYFDLGHTRIHSQRAWIKKERSLSLLEQHSLISCHKKYVEKRAIGSEERF